jgi:hypothetical protein
MEPAAHNERLLSGPESSAFRPLSSESVIAMLLEFKQ